MSDSDLWDIHPNRRHSLSNPNPVYITHTPANSTQLTDTCPAVEEEYKSLLSLSFVQKHIVHKWHILAPCPESVGAARSKHNMVCWGRAIYIFGGDDGKKMLNDLLMYTIDKKTWDRVFTWGIPPTPRYHHSAVVSRDSMFIFGGYTGDTSTTLRNQNDLLEYRFSNCHWIDWSEMVTGIRPASRSAHGSCVYNKWMYVFAGYDGSSRLNDMWRVDLTSSGATQWEQVQQMGDSPPTCCNFPLVTIKDCMYVFSGQSGAKITNNLYQFSFLEQTWIKIQTEYLLRGGPYPPQRRYGHTMTAHSNCLYVFGGSADGTLPNELHKFDVEACSWERVDSAPGSEIPNGRLFHSCALHEDRLYIFGGMIDSSPIRLNNLYSFHLADYPKCTLSDDYSNLLVRSEFCDLKFVVGKQEDVMMAHVGIVAARSPYLRRHLLSTGHFSNADSAGFQPHETVTLVLSDQDPDAFKIALNFLYTDQIKWPKTRIDDINSPLRALECLLELTKLAKLLETEKLEKQCIHYIESSITVTNVLPLLISSNEMSLTRVKEFCIRFIVRDGHYQQVVMLPSFERLKSELLVEIIRKQLKISQMLLQDQFPMNDQFNYNPSLATPQFYPTLESDFKAFLEEFGVQFTDILLKIGSTSFPAHKCILAARCKYFEAMFRSFSPQDGIVNITFGQIVPTCKAFRALLQYIYYGNVKMEPEEALYIFQAPNFFGFSNSRLQVFCKSVLEERISLDNVIKILIIAHEIGMDEVKKHALDIIVLNFSKVYDSANFHDLSKDLLLEIFESIAKLNS